MKNSFRFPDEHHPADDPRVRRIIDRYNAELKREMEKDAPEMMEFSDFKKPVREAAVVVVSPAHSGSARTSSIRRVQVRSPRRARSQRDRAH